MVKKGGNYVEKNNPKQSIEYLDHQRFNDFNLFVELPGYRKGFSLAV